MSPSEELREVELALVTAPDTATAERIAHALVEERLAACVNLVPGLRSIYRWQGGVEDDTEVLLVVKTCSDRARALQERVLALHPYDVPEVLRVPVRGGSEAYLDWVRAESSP